MAPKNIIAIVLLVVMLGGGGLLVWISAMLDKRRRERVMADGVTLQAWLVQANSALFQPQQAPPGFGQPAQFLITFEQTAAAAPEVIRELASRVAKLKDQKPADPDLQAVARLVTDERYRPGRRYRLPDSFTGGAEVYSVHMVVEIARLPAGKLDRPYVFCKAIPGNSGWVFMVDYPEEGPGG